MGCCQSTEGGVDIDAFAHGGKAADGGSGLKVSAHEVLPATSQETNVTTSAASSNQQSETPKTAVELILHLTKGKPLDASDIQTVVSAKRQVRAIRKYAQQYLDSQERLYTFGYEGVSNTNRNDRVALYEKADFASFKKKVYEKSDEIKQLIIDSIKSNALFQNDTDDEIHEFVDVFRPVEFKKGDVVIKQGNKGEDFYFIESGELAIQVTVGDGEERSEVNVGDYGPGSTFGELALMFDSPRAATVTASTDCKLWAIERLAYRSVIGELRRRKHEEKTELVRNCTVDGKKFSEIFDAAQLEDLVIALKEERFDPGEAILREGEDSDTFFIIRSGTVCALNKSNGSEVGSLGKAQAFGLQTMIKDAPTNATYTAESPVFVYFLTKKDFDRMIGSWQDALDGISVSRLTMRKTRLTRKTRITTVTKHDHLKLEDLEKFNVLGKGAFGKVKLVQSKGDKTVFALKALSKAYIVKNKQERHVIREFHTLNDIDHPNIIKIHCAMQDSRYIYFLLDLLPGGELMDHMMKRGKLTEEMTRFYAASVVLAFEEIHDNMIAYRDLKPENMVLDRNGYCVLVDFGLAKEIDEGQTFTFCGTPDYLAPEIIRGTGHDWSVDYWGLGILLYELTSGVAPFYATNQSRRARKILEGYDFVKPPQHFSGSLNSLIKKLLVSDYSQRLGRTQHGVQAIKMHRWFAGFDWEGLFDKKIPVPIVPELASDIKTTGKPDNDVDNAPVSGWNPDFTTTHL